MEPEELETRMRERESFRSLHIDPHSWTILRLDGRAFTKFTATRYQKPFDKRLRDMMIAAAKALFSDFQGLYAHTFSDEISIVFPPGWKVFGGRVEKLVSVSAGLVSAHFTQACGEAAHFDSRIWQSPKRDEVIDYFRWRQGDAARCALNGWCYWTLRKSGMASEEAVALLANKGRDEQISLLNQYDISYDKIPLWQRRGVGLRWQNYEKPGYDPIRQQTVMAQRRHIKTEMELPAGKDYSCYLEDYLGHAIE